MFFQKHLTIRLRENDYERICEALRYDRDGRFDSATHYVRCAVLRQLRLDEEMRKRGANEVAVGNDRSV